MKAERYRYEKFKKSSGSLGAGGWNDCSDSRFLYGRPDGTDRRSMESNGYVVGIDPGHQGSWVDMSDTEPDGPGSENYKAKSSTGTQGSYTGVPEYELNLQISLLSERNW